MKELVELRCAGGITLFTTRETLERAPLSKLATEDGITKTSDPKIISLFLDTLRRADKRLIMPEDFTNWEYLISEARRLGLTWIADAASPSTITVACHAALSVGRLSPEVTFRRVLRIVISGKVSICRSVFGNSLNECRDGNGTDFEDNRYTSRFFLRHNILEKAFDTLAFRGYRLNHSNTFSPTFIPSRISDGTQFIHHSQYIFLRDPQVRKTNKF